MTSYKPGDVILVSFVFADESGVKRRPAVIVSSDMYNSRRGEAVIAAITSKTEHMFVGDHLIADWQEAGLLFPSVATGIIRTIKQSMIDRKLGSMTSRDVEAVNGKLRLIFGFSQTISY